jgi:pyruvate/2-oxoglutarate/acetoin dehydrogenase E1 component
MAHRDPTTEMTLDQAVDHALAQVMEADPRVITWGEDVRLLRRTLLARFGPERVLDTPISEAAFLYAGVGSAIGGLVPVVELYMVDFATVGWAAIVNAAAKVPDFSGGRLRVPMVVRAGYGGWYSDGGQHEQALWGPLAACPGTNVVVPSTPADAAGLMVAALEREQLTILLTPKLLDAQMLRYLGGSGRPTVDFSAVVPAAGARGPVPHHVDPLPFGRAVVRRDGADLLLVSLGVGVHRCLEAADRLARSGAEACVLDLRTVSPLDRDTLTALADRTGRVVVVDEDYRGGGLSGEVAALLLERGVAAHYARVTVESTIPFAPRLEHAVLPNADRIVAAAERLLGADTYQARGDPAPRR